MMYDRDANAGYSGIASGGMLMGSYEPALKQELEVSEPQKNGRLFLRTQITIEIEGEKKPALIAETLALLLSS